MRRHQTFATLAARVSRGIAKLERDELCGGVLTLQQFHTLRLLRDSEGATPSSIAARLGIDVSTASRNLAVLERGGYVSRHSSANDARVVTLQLAAKGRACLQTLMWDERLLYGRLLAEVPAAERDAVVHALALLDRAIAAKTARVAPRAAEPKRALLRAQRSTTRPAT